MTPQFFLLGGVKRVAGTAQVTLFRTAHSTAT